MLCILDCAHDPENFVFFLSFKVCHGVDNEFTRTSDKVKDCERKASWGMGLPGCSERKRTPQSGPCGHLRTNAQSLSPQVRQRAAEGGDRMLHSHFPSSSKPDGSVIPAQEDPEPHTQTFTNQGFLEVTQGLTFSSVSPHVQNHKVSYWPRATYYQTLGRQVHIEAPTVLGMGLDSPSEIQGDHWVAIVPLAIHCH